MLFSNSVRNEGPRALGPKGGSLCLCSSTNGTRPPGSADTQVLRESPIIRGMVQNACHSGDSPGPLDGSGSCSGFCLPRSGGISLPGGASPRVGAVGSEPPILLTRTPNGGDSSTRAGPGVDCDQAPPGTP